MAKLPGFIERHMGPEARENIIYRLQPLLRIHLYGKEDYGLAAGGDIGGLYLLVAIAVMILAIACINFINLATARASRRAREIALRKSLGAYRSQLVGQFMGEALLFTALALLVGLVLVLVGLPGFNDLSGGNYTLTWGILADILPALLAIGLVVGLAAGLYPAMYLSRFEPHQVLKGHAAPKQSGWLRRLLVILQLAATCLLLIGTGMVYRQIEFLHDKPLGFAAEHVVVLPIFARDRQSKSQDEQAPWLVERYTAVKESFLEHPNVLAATAFRFLPGQTGGFVRLVKPEGHEGTQWRMPVQEADESFIAALGVDLLAGRTFSPSNQRDRTHSYILNEKAVRALGWTVADAVGRRFGRARSEEDAKGTVIGVVGDFHYASLRQRVEPAAIGYRQWFYDYLGLRVHSGDLPATIAFLQEQWQTFLPADYPFEYFFLDDSLAQAYRAEEQLAKMAAAFTGLALFLAGLGLFGLASLSIAQRTREIGIRKALGASVGGLFILLSKDSLKLVLLANCIAWPVAYYGVERWLSTFSYHIPFAWEIYLGGGLATLLAALVTTSYQSIKAALARPMAALGPAD
ncbi:MAG: FtsX-like permease family protein [Candidatus Latescibacteria bacterium]|nr:FtsX-like permease family protein [Candidatus Latescibacterota bacterium]